MCHVIAIVGTIFLFRLVFRAMRWRHHFGGGCGGGGWQHHHPHFRGRHGRFRARFRSPIDLGDIGHADGFDDQHDHAAPTDVGAKIDEILRSLDLNARQAAEAGDVISIVRGAVGRDHYAYDKGLVLALRASSKLPFDADLAEAAIGSRVSPAAVKEAVDALEHLHNILTEEQRATLGKLTARA